MSRKPRDKGAGIEREIVDQPAGIIKREQP
jgi:hypothetical protein